MLNDQIVLLKVGEMMLLQMFFFYVRVRVFHFRVL